MNDYIIYYGITLITLIVTAGASLYVNISYKKFSKIRTKKSLTGRDAAQEILDKNGLSDIYIVETKGNLTDHYDPRRKVVRLSTDVYHGESISSVAIAAHECGHAIQDKVGYTFMRIRSILVPIVNISSKVGYIVIVIGIVMESLNLIWTGIILEGLILVFQLVTLPVEIDASRRALEEIKRLNLLSEEEISGGKTVLRAAALTYVAGVLSAALSILRLILIYARNRDN